MEGSEVHGHPTVELLANLRAGALLDDLAEAHEALIDAVHRTGKPGTLTLAIKIEPVKGTADQLLVSEKVTAKMPSPETPVSVFWVDDNGRLTRRDPRQPGLWDGPQAVTDEANSEGTEDDRTA